MEKLNKQIERLLKEKSDELTEEEKQFLHDLLRDYKKTLDDVRRKLSDIYSKYGDDVTFYELLKYDRLPKFELLITAGLIEIYKDSFKKMNHYFGDAYKKSYKGSVESIEKAFNESSGLKTKIGISFGGVPSPELIEAAKENPFDRVKWKFRSKGHHEKAIEQIKQEITQGLIQGKGYSKTAANITDKVNNLANNIVRIVRTESHRIQVKARNEALNKSIKSAERLGIKLVKVWAAIVDGKVRDQHAEMNGKPVDDDGLFTLPDGTRAEAPGQTGVAEHDINCRCDVIVKSI